MGASGKETAGFFFFRTPCSSTPIFSPHLVRVGDDQVGVNRGVNREHDCEGHHARDQDKRRRDLVFRHLVRKIRPSVRIEEENAAARNAKSTLVCQEEWGLLLLYFTTVLVIAKGLKASCSASRLPKKLPCPMFSHATTAHLPLRFRPTRKKKTIMTDKTKGVGPLKSRPPESCR